MMTNKRIIAAMLFALVASDAALAQVNVPMFEGDEKLACEAILCLSSVTRPAACAASLARYFSISGKHMFEARLDFLRLCPSANDNPEVARLAEVLVSAAGNCGVEQLNNYRWAIVTQFGEQQSIGNQMPPACAAYYANPDVAAGDEAPVYVGVPERGGYWVAQKDYAAANAEYQQRIAAEDAAMFRGGD